MKYRCVVSDLDRTILRRDGISHRTKEVLEKRRQKAGEKADE